jgi:8-hydroxy-5-deazaflavin:NADPH oxidoreductase
MPDKYPIIAILGGTGKEGSGLALRWAGVGYKIIIGSRQAEKAQATAADLNHQLGIESVVGMINSEAVKLADICILTVVQEAHQQALESLKDLFHGKILVDATARVDFRNPRPPDPPCAARYAQNILGPTVRMVASFQNVPAKTLKKDIGQSIDADVLVCSDDIPAAQNVILLAQAAGMRGYYAGCLDNAIVCEGITSILISLNQYYGVKNASINISGILG